MSFFPFGGTAWQKMVFLSNTLTLARDCSVRLTNFRLRSFPPCRFELALYGCTVEVVLCFNGMEHAEIKKLKNRGKALSGCVSDDV